ncbi:MAG: LysR family transcriptional regulator [Pseudomonadota bacterium]
MNESERHLLGSDLLLAFVTIAEHKHLTRAANQLGRTQSALSVQLRKIEQKLKCQLFERQSGGMALTPQGERLLPIARGILADLRAAQAMFDLPLRGTLRVGIPDHYDDMVFERVLARFGQSHPQVDLFVTSGCSAHFPQDVEHGRLDIAVISGAMAGIGETLEIEKTVWVESETFDLDPARPVPLAILNRGCWWSNMPISALSEAGRNFNVTFRSTSFSNVRCAIRAGLAIGVLPARALQKGMRISPAERALPHLPEMARSLVVSPKSPSELTSAVAMALKNELASA